MANSAKVADTVFTLALPIAQKFGLTVYETEYKKEGTDYVLRIILDTLSDEESVSIDACEKVSRELSDILDKDDPISGAYVLEVTSPGLDRPLKKEEDFKRFNGKMIDIGLYKPLNGSKILSGILKSYENGAVTVESDGTDIKTDISDTAYIRLAVVF